MVVNINPPRMENPMLQITFTRKPGDLEEVFTDHCLTAASAVPTEIVETVSLSTGDYDRFAATLLKDRDWLAGKGGWKRDGTRLAVAVTAPARRTLYVDPSGSSYARYVGVAPA